MVAFWIIIIIEKKLAILHVNQILLLEVAVNIEIRGWEKSSPVILLVLEDRVKLQDSHSMD